ncbi:MAG TPA: hypothetical protein VII52_05670 [Gemmatimonadaceae bacterium]
MTATARAMALFLAGCALAFALGVVVGRKTARGASANAMDPDVVVTTLSRQLQLDSTQQRQIRDIFRRHQGAVDEAWRSVQPHVRAAIDSTQMEVLGALRPDQRGRFLDIVRSAHRGMTVK